MTVQLFTNNASATLAALFDIGATSLTLNAGQGALFPLPTAGDYFIATVEDNGGNYEIIKITTRAGDAFTVVQRAQEGTTEQSFAATSRVEIRPTAGMMNNLLQKSDGALYYGADKKVVAIAAGQEVRGRLQGGFNDTIIELRSVDGAIRLGIIYIQDNGFMYFQNEVVGRSVVVTAKDNGSVTRVLFSGNPNAEAALFYAGVAKLQTTTAGASVAGDLVATAALNAGSNVYAGGHLSFEGAGVHYVYAAGDWIATIQKDVGITLHGPGNAAKLKTYVNGAVLLSTLSIASPAAANPGYGVLYFVDADNTDEIAGLGFFNDIHFRIINRVRGGDIILGATNAAGGFEYGYAYEPGASAYVYYAGLSKLATVATGVNVEGNLVATGTVSGANVTSGGSNVVSEATLPTALSARKFTSAEQAVAVSGSVAHGLTSPTRVQGFLRCTSGELGYSAGDEVDLTAFMGSGSYYPTTAVWINATNCGWSLQTTNGLLNHKTTGTVTTLNAANWVIVMRAEV